MKVGIVTFNSAHNHGAVLQCWALQEYLKEEGHEPHVINYRINPIDRLYRIYKPRNPFPVKPLNQLVHVAQDLKAFNRDKNKFLKYKKFEHFIRYRLNTTKPIYNYEQLVEHKFDYDALIAGSDQIWNGGFTRLNPGYFLAFGSEDMKRISYAASIGKEELTERESLLFEKYIDNFDAISVREDKAKEQVQKFTDQEIKVVLDPTLLLSKENYDKLKKNPKIKEEYIYVHNVHLTKVDERLNAMAEELSKRTGLPIVHNRADYNLYNEKQKFLSGGPEEFLGWIANARYVIANSFHAAVFSIIYEKEFIIIPHFKNPERMRFLLESFDLEHHLLDDPEELPIDLSELSVDYNMVKDKWRVLRDYSKKFLEDALVNKEQ